MEDFFKERIKELKKIIEAESAKSGQESYSVRSAVKMLDVNKRLFKLFTGREWMD